MNRPNKESLLEAALYQERLAEKRLQQHQERMNEYRDKHELDLTDPMEPFYGEDPWYQQVDQDTDYQEAISGNQSPF